MTSGVPLSEDDKQYIIENKHKFYSTLANDCGCSKDAVRNVLKKENED